MGVLFIVVLLALLASGPIMAIGFNKRQDENNRRLISFILQNYEALAGGATVDYNGTPMTVRSRLTRYRYCYSYIIMTSYRSSGLYLADGTSNDEDAKNAKLTCQLITALSGWWGIPWGIIYSIQFLVLNGAKNGTNDETVGGIMQKLQNTEQN